MRIKTITLATAAAVSLLIAAPNTQAQERGDQDTPKTDLPKTDRPQDVEKIDKDKVKGARPITAGEKGQGPNAEKKATLKLVQAAMREETKHRQTLAKIKRLREVFTEKGDEAQLEKLAGATEREDARYKKVVAAAKAQMGDKTFAEVAALMEAGKKRVSGKVKEKKEDESATDRKPDGETDKGRPTDRKREGETDKGRTTDRKREGETDKGRTTDRKREGETDKGRTTDRKREGETDKGRTTDRKRTDG